MKYIQANQAYAKAQQKHEQTGEFDVFDYSYGVVDIDQRMLEELTILYRSGKTYKYVRGESIWPSEKAK